MALPVKSAHPDRPHFFLFFEGFKPKAWLSRAATMLRGRRLVQSCGCRWCGQRHQTRMGAQAGAPFAKRFGCVPLTGPSRRKERDKRKVASQKLNRAPCRPVKASGLTWASGPAARSPMTEVITEKGRDYHPEDHRPIIAAKCGLTSPGLHSGLTSPGLHSRPCSPAGAASRENETAQLQRRFRASLLSAPLA
jgi:hypothetical protein